MKDNSNNDLKEYQKQLNLSLIYTNKMWKKIASNHISKIYKELIQPNIKNKQPN